METAEQPQFYSAGNSQMEASETEQKLAAKREAPGCLSILFGFPIASLGALIVTIVGILLITYVATRVCGGPPQLELVGTCLVWVAFGVPLFVYGLWLLRRFPKWRTWKKMGLLVVVILAVLGFDALLGPNNWQGIFRAERTVRGNANNLKATYVTPHLEVQILPGTNLIWCGTFQLAWNEACTLAGGDLHLANLQNGSLTQNPVAAALNKHAFTEDCIDVDGYVAMAGFTKDNIHQKFEDVVKEKLKFSPQLVSHRGLATRREDFETYAALRKSLSFPVPFERLDDSFRFANKQVRAFGIANAKSHDEARYSEVLILDYQSPENFIVELKTTPAGDRLLLAKVHPKDTLGELVAEIRTRAANYQPQPAGTNDVIEVPKIGFDILREYAEIENRWLVPLGRNVAPDLFVRSAMQSIKFDMDERGVELRSEAHMTLGCSAEQVPVRPHIMIFDRPFLLMLERTGARTPYFVLWVDNPEILIPW
jgi:hypothetical protein